MQSIEDINRLAMRSGTSYGKFVAKHDPPKQPKPKQKPPQPKAVTKELPRYRTCVHAKFVKGADVHNVLVEHTCPRKKRDKTKPIEQRYSVYRAVCFSCEHYRQDMFKF